MWLELGCEFRLGRVSLRGNVVKVRGSGSVGQSQNKLFSLLASQLGIVSVIVHTSVSINACSILRKETFV